jgi:hypothetical protein
MMQQDGPGNAADAAARITGATRDEQGRLVVHLAGREPLVDARVARCFPWSVPGQFISIRSKEGKEVALLTTLDELPPEARGLIEQELGEKVFNPRILRVIECKHEFGMGRLIAQTDRGEVTFEIRTRDDVRVLSPIRALLRDADGNTYEVPDINALDRASRKHLDQYF